MKRSAYEYKFIDVRIRTTNEMFIKAGGDQRILTLMTKDILFPGTPHMWNLHSVYNHASGSPSEFVELFLISAHKNPLMANLLDLYNDLLINFELDCFSRHYWDIYGFDGYDNYIRNFYKGESYETYSYMSKNITAWMTYYTDILHGNRVYEFNINMHELEQMNIEKSLTQHLDIDKTTEYKIRDFGAARFLNVLLDFAHGLPSPIPTHIIHLTRWDAFQRFTVKVTEYE